MSHGGAKSRSNNLRGTSGLTRPCTRRVLADELGQKTEGEQLAATVDRNNESEEESADDIALHTALKKGGKSSTAWGRGRGCRRARGIRRGAVNLEEGADLSKPKQLFNICLGCQSLRRSHSVNRRWWSFPLRCWTRKEKVQTSCKNYIPCAKGERGTQTSTKASTAKSHLVKGIDIPLLLSQCILLPFNGKLLGVKHIQLYFPLSIIMTMVLCTFIKCYLHGMASMFHYICSDNWQFLLQSLPASYNIPLELECFSFAPKTLVHF